MFFVVGICLLEYGAMAGNGIFRGHYEDLIQLIIRLELRALEREKHVLPVKPAWQRAVLEAPLNLLSGTLSLILRILPHRYGEAFFLFTYDKLTNNKYHSIGKEIANNSNSAYKLYDYIKSRYPEPALLSIPSHPPVIGEIRDLNLGLMGASYRLMHAVRGSGRPFRIVAAVDVMALDTLSVPEEAVYAGSVGLYHVSMDRLPSARNTLQRLFLGGTTFDSAAWRLVDALLDRQNIVMIPAGGVGETARLIYTSREFVWRLRRDTRKKPWEVLAALSSRTPLFSAFLNNFQEGGNGWKRIEGFLVALLARDPLVHDVPRTTLPPCSTGRLEETDIALVRSVISAFGIEGEAANKQLSDFTQEFSRITPYRRRLFRILLAKVVSRGVPILLLPLDFSTAPETPILRREPLALVPRAGGGVYAVSLKNGSVEMHPIPGEEFFRDWGLATYSS